MKLRVKPAMPYNQPVSYRLRQAMDAKGINCAQLAKTAHVKTSFLYDILNGKSANPSVVQLSKVAAVLDINLSYLAGNCTDSDAHNRADTTYTIIPAISYEHTTGKIITREDKASPFQLNEPWAQKTLGTKASNLRAFLVKSDEMSPTLQPHDMAFIDISQTVPTPPGVFLIFDGSGLTIRRLELIQTSRKKQVRIIADNLSYSSDDYGLDELLIVGRVVWVSRFI